MAVDKKRVLTPFSILFALLVLWALPAVVCGRTLVEWDFTKDLHGWIGNNKVENLSCSPQGLLVRSTGLDPWVEGPAVDLPGDKIIGVKIRMKSNADAGGELFYGRAFRAGHSVRFTVRADGKWHDYSLVIREKLGQGTRFRLDPCTGAGEVTVGSIDIEAISEIVAPALEKPAVFEKNGGSLCSVKSDSLEFEYYGGDWGKLAFKVDGVEMAVGCDGELIGLVLNERAEWISLKNAEVAFDNRPNRNECSIVAAFEDGEGGEWNIKRTVKSSEQKGTLEVNVELTVNKDRDVVHIPWLTIFPGLGTFGERKYQGLFAGLEYLCDEPSSSQADITTQDHVRRVPDPLKITFPLMAIAQDGNYIGVIWKPSGMVSASFDSPDRIYNSGAHLMSLSGPAVGEDRFENDFCAHTPFKLHANEPLRVSLLIIGGRGKTVVSAVKHYVALKDLPAVPEFEGGFDAAVGLLAHGWLDSKINENTLFRHAVWGDSFPASPAADAAAFIAWLAGHTADEALGTRLDETKNMALDKIPSEQPFSSAVSHAHLPTAPLVFGRTYEFVQQRQNESLNLLRDFDSEGVKLYKPRDTDYSRTHFAKHANGLSGSQMVRILEGATLSADKELIAKALTLLDKQTSLYAETVPRGAQTWEVPLHTPDILASAHMVKAYTLGYIISGDRKYLEQARYWAWTGVPFVYLYPPTGGRVGPYATIAVLGATNWKAPLWLGRPVQWCGLVYCSALHMLSECDPEGPWEKIAKGITAAGLQMSWPLSDKERQGLLPDFFDLNEQIAAGPAINPGTVQAHLSELYGRGKIYDVKRLPTRGWFVHAPCAISDVREDREAVTLILDGWGNKSSYVLVSGVEKEPREVLMRRIGQNKTESAEKEFHSERKVLIVTLKGSSEITIR